MTWQSFLFIIVASLAFGFSTYKFTILYRMLKNQSGKARPIDRIPERILTLIVNVLGHKAVLEKRVIGILHLTIFWGFIIITVGTLEQFVSTVYQPANFQFIGQIPYSFLVCLQ